MAAHAMISDSNLYPLTDMQIMGTTTNQLIKLDKDTKMVRSIRDFSFWLGLLPELFLDLSMICRVKTLLIKVQISRRTTIKRTTSKAYSAKLPLFSVDVKSIKKHVSSFTGWNTKLIDRPNIKLTTHEVQTTMIKLLKENTL